MEVPRPLWNDQAEAHVARHDVSRSEIEELVVSGDTLAQTDDRRPVPHRATPGVGRTAAGRPLLVIFDHPTPAGDAYVVTARPMTARERRAYEEATQ